MVAATPTRLGRYQILDQIGKGAMGVVYLAKDPLIGRLVALKTFRIGDLDDEDLQQSRQRFMREAQSAGILSHPNIVTVHDVVEEEGLTFLTMEFVRGTDLKELLRRGESFDLAAVSDVIWQVAEALEYAHSKGVVHRDIKPANILITGDGRVKLTDFGIARLDTSNLTHDGQLLGTPNYMSPEQIRGAEVDHRADIFSLGVVLYEMLTRHKPFQGENLTVVTHRIIHENFTPPEEYAGPLPQPLLEILARALAKDPADRYQQVGEMARDLKLVADEAEAQAALCDTQEIELPAAAAPEAPPPEAREGWSGRAGALLARARAAVEPLAQRLAADRPLPSARRLLLVAAVAALGGLALGAAALFLAAPHDDPAAEARRDSELRRRYAYLPLVFDGRRLLAEGNPDAAVAAFTEAERLAPGEERVRRLREEAERRSAEAAARALKEEAAAEALAQGEEAFARRRFTTALEAAERALALVPDHPRAQDLLARAEFALDRSRRPAIAAPPVAAAAPTAQPVPSAGERGADPGARAAGPEQEPQGAARLPPGAVEATLHMLFHSDSPQGVLTVYADQEQLWREPFKFTEKTGFLRTRPVPGDLARTATLRPGPVTLRIYVTLDKTRTEILEGNFPAGSVRTLEIRVSERGDLDVELR